MGKVVKTIAGVAIGVAIAVLAAPTGGLSLVAALGFTGSAALVASAVLTVGLTLAAGAVFKALTQGAPTAQVGPPTVFRQSIADSFIVYGKRRVGGLLVFFHPRKVGKRHYRYFVIACAGHRCKGRTRWFLGDQEASVDGAGKVTSGPYANAAWLWFQRGLAAETANATFVAECGGKWTAAHRGDGIAAIYAKFEMTDAVVEAGMPNITAEIEGKDDIADPRDGLAKYTRNASLVFYDWMGTAREEGGFGCYLDEVPEDALIAAWANVCDEAVDGEERYALDAVIVTGAAPSEVRDAMVVNCAGSYTFAGGLHLMRPGYWVPVSATLAEDDLAGPIRVSPFLAGDQAANEVQGTFVDPAAGYQGAAAPTQAVAAADVRQISVDLSMVTSAKRAARIMRIMMRRAQAEKSVVWPMNIAGLKVKALDSVQLGTTRYGLGNYAFQVAGWRFSAEWGVTLALREENADIYADVAVALPPPPPAIDRADAVALDRELATLVGTSSQVDLTITATDSSATISNHIRRYADRDVTVTGATIGGLTAQTDYYFHYPDPERDGGAVTYTVTTDYFGAFNSAAEPDRHYAGYVRTPAAGGSSTGGGSLPPGGALP